MNVFHLTFICFKLNVIFLNVGYYYYFQKNLTPAPAPQCQDLYTKTSAPGDTMSTSASGPQHQELAANASAPKLQHQNHSIKPQYKTFLPMPQHQDLSTKTSAP